MEALWGGVMEHIRIEYPEMIMSLKELAQVQEVKGNLMPEVSRHGRCRTYKKAKREGESWRGMLYDTQIRSDNDQPVKFRMGTVRDRLNV